MNTRRHIKWDEVPFTRIHLKFYISGYFHFWQRLSLRDEVRDVQFDFRNITCRPLKWDDVLITRINSKICISGSFFQLKCQKVSYSFYFWLWWFLRDDLWDDQLEIWNIIHRPIMWNDVFITYFNSKICISSSFLSIQESKSVIFFLFLA